MDTADVTQEIKKPASRRAIFLYALSFVITIALCVAAIIYKDKLLAIANLAGYSLLGVLIVSLVAGSVFSITAIPVPYWLLVFTLPTVLAPQWGILAPLWVGLTSALGCTLGQLPTFLIGYGGSSLSKSIINAGIHNRFYNRVMRWAQRHGAWASFAISATFNPLHLPMTVAMGALRFSPPKFVFFSFLGNSVKSLILAFGGYFGVNFILRILESI